MQNGGGGGGWSLKGPDPCAAGAGETDPEVGGEAGIADDDEEGRSGFPGGSMASAALGQKGDMEVRERREKGAGRPRHGLYGAGRLRTSAGRRRDPTR